MMEVAKIGASAGAILGQLTSDQQRCLDAIDAKYVELLSSDHTPNKTDVEALAEAVVAFYDDLAKMSVGRESRS